MEIYRSYNYSDKDNIIKIDCKGNGTKDQPFIIDSSVQLPHSFEINESKAFINITNCTLKNLKITISKNITMNHCNIKKLKINSSTNVQITNVSTRDIGGLVLEMSDHCTLDGCEIKYLAVFNSSHNLIKNCKIKRLYYNLFNRCRDNTFENNVLSQKQLAKVDHAYLDNGENPRAHQIFVCEDCTPITIECTGRGFKDDPFIITPQEIPDKRINLLLSPHYMQIKQFTLNEIYLKDCKNKVIEDCDLKYCDINESADIRLENTNFEIIGFGQCQNISLNHCVIKNIKLYKSFTGGISIKNSAIDNISGKNVDRIEFQNTEIENIAN